MNDAYDVLISDELDDLIEEVNQRIHDGWKPIGGIEIITEIIEIERKGYTKTQITYLQAIYKDI